MKKRMKSHEARKHWRDVLDYVRAGNEVVIEHYTKPVARIVPIEETHMARYTVRPFGQQYWTVHDTALRNEIIGIADLTKEHAQTRATQLEQTGGAGMEFLPHCQSCEEHVATDDAGNAVVHTYPSPRTEEDARYVGHNCGGSRKPTYQPAYRN